MCTGTHSFIEAPRTARLELIYVANGQRVENVFHVEGNDEWSGAALLDLAERAISGWETAIGGHTSNGVELVLVRATDVGVEDGAGVEIAPESPVVGDLTSPIMPNNVTVATKFSGGFTGRSRRGRAYFVGLTEVQVLGNQIEPSGLSSINNGYPNFFAELSGGENNPRHVVTSYCNNGAWRTTALNTVITSYSTEANIDSQRRRLTTRGA